MKLIFLDIDGVLNYELQEELEGDKERQWPLSKRCIKLLNELIEQTGAKVVISSTWRIHFAVEDIQELFERNGFQGEIVGRTPKDRSAIRGVEILEFLKNQEKLINAKHYNYNQYIILDDDSDMMLCQRENFFLVDNYIGLTPNLIYKASRFLNRYE